jgi:thiamine monophosphate synthase
MDLPALLITLQAGSLLEPAQAEQLAEAINDAITAGATAVLLAGSDNAAVLYEAAVKVKELLRERAALLLLDRLDIAAAVGAEGVVLSQTGGLGVAVVAKGSVLWCGLRQQWEKETR